MKRGYRIILPNGVNSLDHLKRRQGRDGISIAPEGAVERGFYTRKKPNRMGVPVYLADPALESGGMMTGYTVVKKDEKLEIV